MATRMQQRRGTASQWTTANPILATGEIGFETDTNQFKIGDGTNNWSALSYFKNLEDLGGSLDDYLLVENVGQAGFAASLDENGYIPIVQLGNVIGDAPEILDTISELAEAVDGVNGIVEVRIQENIDSALAQVDYNMDAERVVREAAEQNLENSISTSIANANESMTEYVDSEISSSIAAEVLARDAAIVQAINNEVTARDEAITESASSVTGNLESFATDAAADAQASAETTAQGYVSTHNSDTTNVHGIADTSVLATNSYVDSAAAGAFNDATGNTNDKIGDLTVDGSAGNTITDRISSSVSSAISSHSLETTNVHGIADTADLLLKSGGTMTGDLTLSGAPTSSLHAATKQYVDNTASGIVAKPQVLGATTANIDATYSNGTAGVGATLTHNSNGAFPTNAAGAEGWALGKGILVKNQTNKAENGRYYISDMGSPSTPYVLTRCGYCDEASEIPGAYIFVQDGTNAGTGWVQTVADATTFTVGTDDINVVQFSGSGTITAGTNISVSGNEISLIATPELSGVEFSDGTQTKQGVPSLTYISAQTANNYTLTLTDRDSLIEMGTNGTGRVIIPADSDVDFPVGSSIDILKTSGAGTCVIEGATGSTNVIVNATPGLKLRTQWSSATLFKRAPNTWVAFGDLSA
jgi:hypothetical protein